MLRDREIRVRAEGLEPSRSFEHRHLKPARMPFRHARSVPIVPLRSRTDTAVARRDEFVGPKP